MSSLVREVSLVKIAVISRKDLDQIGMCAGLYMDDDGSVYQKEPGKPRRELAVIGWFLGSRREKRILVQRLDDGRLLQEAPFQEMAEKIVRQCTQLFVR